MADKEDFQQLSPDEIDEEPNIVTIKSLTPTSDQLESLGLQPGMNYITFSVKSRL